MSAASAVLMSCLAAAGARYHLPPRLLDAIAHVESSHNPTAVAHAKNGSVSIGVMQINSSWFDALQSFGIQPSDLWDPCTNVHVGAWILAQEVARYGYNWEAIGAYYAGPYDSKSRNRKLVLYREYATKVISRWKIALSQQDSRATK